MNNNEKRWIVLLVTVLLIAVILIVVLVNGNKEEEKVGEVGQSTETATEEKKMILLQPFFSIAARVFFCFLATSYINKTRNTHFISICIWNAVSTTVRHFIRIKTTNSKCYYKNKF